jgi:adenylylsulfate kinase
MQVLNNFPLGKACPGVIWFTGRPGAGKTTIAQGVREVLENLRFRTCLMDGDLLRRGLNADLGYDRDARNENIRRALEVAKLFRDEGFLVLAAFITPFGEQRRVIRERVGGRFLEVYVKCDLAECRKRDPKQFYARAQAGMIPDFTGITSPFEEPESPDLVIDTQQLSIADAIAAVLYALDQYFDLRIGNLLSGMKDCRISNHNCRTYL